MPEPLEVQLTYWLCNVCKSKHTLLSRAISCEGQCNCPHTGRIERDFSFYVANSELSTKFSHRCTRCSKLIKEYSVRISYSSLEELARNYIVTSYDTAPEEWFETLIYKE